MRQWTRSLILLLLFLILLWGEAFLWFINLIPTQAAADNEATDAIVVLTGGSLRLDRGFELLAQGRARKLLITGVEEGVTLSSLLRKKEYRAYAPRITLEDVELGYKAHTTEENAIETAQWIGRENVKSIRLVTGSYHMPRSIYEIHKRVPEVKIVAEPVFPKPFDGNAWWKWGDGLRLVVSEYHKYLASIVRHGLREDV